MTGCDENCCKGDKCISLETKIEVYDQNYNEWNSDKRSQNQRFLHIASDVASDSTCLRRHVGAVITFEGRSTSSGYNGSPSGTYNCKEIKTCRKEREGFTPNDYTKIAGVSHGDDICVAVHAEINSIINANGVGDTIYIINKICREGNTIYESSKPCLKCSGGILNTKRWVGGGIKKIVYLNNDMTIGVMTRDDLINAINQQMDKMYSNNTPSE